MKIFTQKLFLQIDNSPLIIFRILLGLLLFIESFGSILTGWVKNNLITPRILFPFIGFEWLHPLPGYGMYFYFALMAILGLFVMIGYRYKASLFCFLLLWTAQYLMQKTSYNNHYYFLILICFIMLFLPANAYCSFDSKRNKRLKSLFMPQWCSYVLMLQIAILYFYATIAKLYPDWLDGTFTRLLYSNKTNFPVIGKYFTEKWFYLPIAYLGILFDGLVVPLLLWKKTRTIALIANIIFHLSNSLILQVGIFPYFALSFVVFFYPPETIRRIFFRKRPTLQPYIDNVNFKGINVLKYLFIPYFMIQIFLPLRHWLIEGDVFWTEEGHRLSWRMMLRKRSGYPIQFLIIDKKTGKEVKNTYSKNNLSISFSLDHLLTEKQKNKINTSPDVIWQMAQYIKKDFKQKGIDVAVYADCWVSINNHPYKRLVNEKTDLANVKWNYFTHSPWILLYEDYRK